MGESDRKPFYELIANVYAFYRIDCTPFALGVWWEACKPFDLPAVSRALSAHAVNPDSGQFLPKPADVVRVLQGGTQDQANRAWSKVDAAVRSVGTYRDVVFDDTLVHAVLRDMGGWMQLGEKTEDDWPFLRNEFVNRYRGFSMRAERPEYPPVLIGIAGAYNRKERLAADAPVLLGDPAKARAVMQGGSDKPRLTVTHLADVVPILPDKSAA
jgi:enamine deaminase RidA (YjgF/YER057c/UK114 family)